jgi:hypothetical protein
VTPGRGGTGWAERYEQLRAHATSHAPVGVIPLGLALLQHRGMVAWMTAPGSGSSDDAGVPASRRPGDRTGDAVDARRRDLVRLLAGVAFPLAMTSAP